MTKVHIQKAILEARNSLEKRKDKALMDARETEERLDNLCRFNLKNYFTVDGRMKEVHELTPEEAICVREMGHLETQIGAHRTIKFINVLDALTKKMQRLGMLKEVVQVEDPYVVWLRQVKEAAARKNGDSDS